MGPVCQPLFHALQFGSAFPQVSPCFLILTPTRGGRELCHSEMNVHPAGESRFPPLTLSGQGDLEDPGPSPAEQGDGVFSP